MNFHLEIFDLGLIKRCLRVLPKNWRVRYLLLSKTTMARARTKGSTNSSAQLGFEAKLWRAADKLRTNMDAAEYRHVVLGLIFLKGLGYGA